MTRLPIEPGDQLILRAILRQDLGAFVARVFQTVSPGDRYLHNWHIDAIVHELMQIHGKGTGGSSSPSRPAR